MNGFIGLNDVLKNISLIARERKFMKEWYKQRIAQVFSKEEPETDNN